MGQGDLDERRLATEAMEEARRVSFVEVVPSVDHDYRLKDTNHGEDSDSDHLPLTYQIVCWEK